MITKYLIVFLISMVPLIELRGAIPYAVAFHIPTLPAYLIAVIGNMLPVPIIFLFARKVLVWGCDKKYIGKFFTWCLEKGEKGGSFTIRSRFFAVFMKVGRWSAWVIFALPGGFSRRSALR